MYWFLKWYYGYKNLWDEILFFGVLKRIFDNYDINKLFVEVWDVNWFSIWIDRNKNILWSNVTKIELVDKYTSIPYPTLKFFWGWEVLTDQRSFPHDGWNLLIRYYKDIISWNFILLWWVWTPHKWYSRILYKLILPKARQVVVREKTSQNILLGYTKQVILKEDFAYWIYLDRSLKKISRNKRLSKNKSKNVLLVNLNPYINDSATKWKISSIIQKMRWYKKVFIPFDIDEDMPMYKQLKQTNPELDLFDWTTYSIDEILEFISQAKEWIWARLHFLLLMNWMGLKVHPLKYQEKIGKFFA